MLERDHKMRKLKTLVLVCLLISYSGCINQPKIKAPEVNQGQAKTPGRWQWRVKEVTQRSEIKIPAVQIDFKFEQIEIKEVIKFLMELAQENYVISDELIGQVDVEIKGMYNQEEIINIVKIILNSKNYDLKKHNEIYLITPGENKEDDKKGVKIELPEDVFERNIYIYKLQFETTENMKMLLESIYTLEKVKIDEVRNLNMLIIKAEKKEYEEIEPLIKKFDVQPKQVLVEMTLLDVTLVDSLKFGVEYFIRNNKTSFGNISLLADGITSGVSPIIGNGLKAISFSHQLDSFVTLLRSQTKVDIIAKPKLLVQDGKSSVIKIGRSEPIRKGTSVGSNNQVSENIEYRDTGIILNVKINVEENNVVKLELSQEVSDIIKSVENPLINSPSFTTKNISINTLLNDGQSVYIGGLMETSESKLVKKVPLIGDIPYLGKLFRSNDTISKKTELILLVSVEILIEQRDFENIKLKFVK